MAKSDIDSLLHTICYLNDALKYVVRYGTDDATAFEKQQQADAAISKLLETWEWNKPMAEQNTNEMGEVAKDLIALSRSLKEHGILDEIQDITVTYRVGELWKTVTLTFRVDEEGNALMTAHEGKD